MFRAPVLLVALFVALSLWLWDSWTVYPLKLLTVHFHESGHALATWLVGGRVDSIAITLGQGGLTRSRVPVGLLPALVVASGGYVGSALFGSGILWSAGRSSTGKTVLEVLAAFLIVALALWARDGFTVFFTAAMALALALLARWLPPRWSRGTAIFLGIFSGLYALWDIRDDLILRQTGRSDADALASLTGVPSLAWAILWLGISVAALWYVLRRAVLR